MFLSRVEIPWVAARNAYEIHRQVWKLFPDEEKEQRARAEEVRQGFLFRVEDSRPGKPARLLVQSRRAPQANARIRTERRSERSVAGVDWSRNI